MKSYQVRYDLNMDALGVPGLSFMTRYDAVLILTLAQRRLTHTER